MKAAPVFLDPNDQWWIVDLFLADCMDISLTSCHSLNLLGLPEETHQSIRKEYDNAKAFCDGDIFRNIRHHKFMATKLPKTNGWPGLAQEAVRGAL